MEKTAKNLVKIVKIHIFVYKMGWVVVFVCFLWWGVRNFAT